jgi:superfamily II helicase
MNNRIYSTESYSERQMNTRYCPYCLGNNLSSNRGWIQLIHNYICLDCGEEFDKNISLTKNIIRENKINNILNVK